MTSPLGRGANTAIPTAPVDAAVAGAARGTVDLLVFQLAAGRRVRSDADLVFFNQPDSPEGVVRLTGGDQVSADLVAIPDEIETLAVAVALDAEEPGSLADIPGLAVRVTTSDGVVDAPALDLATERAAVLVEIYRRGGGWKVRNVSAGWTGGLADLVREHGVTVDDDVAPPPPLPAPEPPVGAAADLVKRTGAISLVKGERVSIEKSPLIVAEISWPPKTDYDVYALVRYRDGRTETVATFGTREEPDFSLETSDGAVRHQGDRQRSREQVATERIEIRLNPDIVAVVPVVYSAQSNGTGSFRKYKVSMAIDNGAGTRVQVDAAEGHRSSWVFTCVPGVVLNTADGVQIHSLELYSKRASERRPTIADDLTVQMDTGGTNLRK